jgi:hypothetical protein
VIERVDERNTLIEKALGFGVARLDRMMVIAETGEQRSPFHLARFVPVLCRAWRRNEK